ncbi:MAG: fibronectin type III domain-containing protein, partial [Candidatus Polarisedimenticolia bacterium]
MDKTRLILLNILVSCAGAAAGQAAPPADAGAITSYGMTGSSAPFVALSGATRVAGIEGNDAGSDAIPVGFTFWYMGVPYTQVWANSNGFLSFNAAAPTTSTANMRANALSGSPAALRPLVAPLWDDLSGASSGVASYLTSGDPGSRVFTFEWLNWKWSGTALSPVISMQVRLHETDGRVELAYRQEAGAVSAASASIGLAATGTGSGNFLSLQSTGAAPTVSSATEASNLAAKPATDQLYTFTPPAVAPGAPTNLIFTSVTGTSMTLNWTDVAGEAGYTILRSTDGVSYAFAATTAAGTVSYAAGGLSLGTTYHWQVHAVTVGLASAPLSGSQATTPAGEVTCVGAGGNWNAGATWSGGAIPSPTDNVTITDGCTVTLNAAATINRLTVGQGASGVLQFEASPARTLTVNTDTVIATGGTLQSAATGTVTTHQLQVGGSLNNNGTLDLSTNANTAGAELRFTGTSAATFTGTGTTDLRLLSLSKGDIGTVLQVNLPFTVRGAAGSDPVGFLTIPHVGTLRLSGTATYASNLFTSAA